MDFKDIPSNWRIVLPPAIQKKLLDELVKIKRGYGLAAKELNISRSSLIRYKKCNVFLPKKVFITLCKKLGKDPIVVFKENSNQAVSFLYKTKIDKNKRLQEVLTYVKKCVKRGHYPTGTALHKKFRIYNYGIDIKTIYSRLGTNFLFLPHKSHRMVNEIRKLLIAYLRKEVDKGHYPTRKEIKSKFRLDLSPVLFKGIKDLYKKAGIPYKQVENQAIKIDKAKKFLKIVLNVLKRMELDILNVSEPNQPGIDIIVNTLDGKVGIELKAYNKFESVKRKDVSQLKKFFAKEKFKKIFLFTTTNRISTDFPRWVKIFTFQKLKRYCDEDEIRILNEIREKSVHIESKDKEVKRQKILEYVKESAGKGRYVGAYDILRNLKLCVYTYFKSMDEVYERAGIKVSLKRSRYLKNKKIKEKVREELLSEILEFIKNEVAKGHYPSGVDIGNAFGVKHIWNYWKVSELYKMLNLPTYLERVKNRSFNPFRRC